MSEIIPIGVVEREIRKRVPPKELRDEESTVVVDAEFEEGLYRIEENDHIVVVFHLHRSDGYTLCGNRLYGFERGVFDSRSPNRPGNVGVTTVELVERDGRRLRVRGLDAIDGTPVLDIKPYVPGLDTPPEVAPEGPGDDPRAGVEEDVRTRNLDSLLLDAGALHGRFCPELAVGVMATTYAARELEGTITRGLRATVGTTGCFVDGVQYVLGCTIGNGRLHRGDAATPVITVWNDDRAVRVRFRPDAIRDRIGAEPPFDCDETVTDEGRARAATAAFDVLDYPLSELCMIETDAESPDVSSDAPD